MLDSELQRLARDVIVGFDNASGLYRTLSGGWEVHMAPEYFCTVKVAENLYMPGSRYVTMEQNITDALRWTGREGAAEPSGELPRHGRFDIAVWGPGSDGILGIVEIKEVKYVTFADVKRDVDRVCEALKQTKLKWGMVAYHASLWKGDAKTGEPKSATERLETRTATIEESARRRAAEFGLRCTRLKGVDRELDDEYQGGIGRAEVLVFDH